MKLRLTLVLGALAFVAWSFAPSAANAQLDHYKCYQGKDLKNPKFVKVPDVHTVDQITDEKVTVQKVKFVCNPVSVDNSVINDPNAHLICYQIKGATFASGSRPHVQVSTQFQISQFEIKKPKLLCVPGTKQIIP